MLRQLRMWLLFRQYSALMAKKRNQESVMCFHTVS